MTEPFLTDLPVALARRLEKACDRFEAEWRGGGRPRLDDFLAGAGDDLYPILLRELVLLDADYRREAGEQPSAADYQTRFPALDPAWLDEAREAASSSPAPPAATRPDRVQETVGEVRSDSSQAGMASPGRKPGESAAEVPAALAEHCRYRVLKALGGGGMGTVYLAEHTVMKRSVALKVIRPDLTARPEAVERFRREVEAAVRLTHPNIVASYDAEQAGDCLFLAMEYVEGTDLAAWLAAHGPLPVPEACDYVRQAALGLQCAHERGMVHRDLKPQNLMRTATGQVKVLDFGLARLIELAQEGGTAVGMVLGTPDYIAPEQTNDAHGADIRADVYSLGCTLYHLLGGKVPFPGGGLLDKLRRHAQEQPESLARLRPDLPAPLVAVVEGMMARDPARRPQTPAEVAAALAPWCRPEPETTHQPQPKPAAGRWWRRKALVAAAVTVVVLGAGLAYVLRNTGPQPEEGNRLPDLSKGPQSEKGDRPPDLSKWELVVDEDFSVPDYFAAAIAVGQAGGLPNPWQVGWVAQTTIKPYFDSGKAPLGGYRRFEGGRYVMGMEFMTGEGDRCNHVHREETLSGDFACEVTGRLLGGRGDHGWALSLCHRRFFHSTIVQLRRDGRVEVATVIDDKPITTLVPPIRYKAIQSGEEFNTLLVVCRRDRVLEVSVNGSSIGPPLQLPKPLGPVHPGLMYSQVPFPG